jgi:hypothetical protein
MNRILINPDYDAERRLPIRRTVAAVAHAPLLISEPTMFFDAQNQQPLGAYMLLEDTGALEVACCAVKMSPGARTRGLRTSSRVFGYQARVPLRRDYCSVATLARESPRAHQILLHWGERLSSDLAALFPQQHAFQKGLLEGAVATEWRIPNSVFTSGIVNRNNQLAYHKDQGNFPATWSAMAVFRRRTLGGCLVVPAWGVSIACENRSILFFEGTKWLHGVSPIELDGPTAQRHSIVWYAMRGLAKALSPEGERARVAELRVQREAARLFPPDQQRARLKGAR